MRRRRRAALPTLLAAAWLAAAADARAFCRTMTCPLPPDFAPGPGGCVPDDFASYCASLSPPVKPLPVWWRNACVSYDIQKDGTKQIAFDTVSSIVAAAFAKWTSAACAGAQADAGSSRVSIDVRDLGPVACDQVQYNSNQGNQHVILFHDDVWPHNDANNTLGLTTITFDPDTGEIYDADMEINATVPLSVGDTVPPDGYDFDSIITHESGHFLGMAHSGDERATMFAHYAPGSTWMRVLSSDDVSGICAIYPPGGRRAVDPSASPDGSGFVAEDACDPTPRHGFSSECAQPPAKGCAVASPGEGGGDAAAAAADGAALVVLASSLLAGARRHRRRAHRPPPACRPTVRRPASRTACRT
jgi:hypothetical protein